MKKIVLATIIGLLSFTSTSACEICGCGLGNYYIGLLPQYSHKFFGVRYQVRNFHTVMADDNTQFSHDYYKSVEVWGGWNIGRKLQLIGILPYNFVHQVSDDGVTNSQGIGDVALMANYKVFESQSKKATKNKFKQELWLGAGVKLPTGKFEVDATDPAIVALANTQTGSASTDFMLNAMYNVKINKLGINTSASYKLNTSNKDNYTFGNKLTASSFAFYSINKGTVAFVPNVGLLYENSASSKLNKASIEQTGGHLLSTAAGLECSINRINIGANVQLPLTQNFAWGQTEMKVKGLMHMTYSF